jgi:hypothetical protein
MADFQQETKSDKFYEMCWACGPILGITVVLGLFVSSCVYFGYSIIALANISNTSIKDDCASSNIWIFLLLSIILGLMNHSQSFKQFGSDKQEWGKLVCINLAQLGFTSWGAYELWGIDCVDTSNLVYEMAEIYVIASYTISGLALMIACVFSAAFIIKD